MKKMILLFLMIVTCFSTTTYAADIPIKAVTEETTKSPPDKNTLPSPIAVDQKNVDGTEYLIKTFETAVGFDPSLLVENGFEQDGFLFAHLTTEKNVNEKKEAKEATESVTVETNSNNMEGILKRLPSTMDYNKEGFSGVLTLRTDSVATQVSGYTTKTSTISTVKDYPGLMYADPSYVAQTASKNGVTLPLVDINWVVMGTGLAGDTLVPTEYKAIASYAKQVSSKVPSGYVTTANYSGAVGKTEAGTVNYVVTYVGTPLHVELPDQKGLSFPVVIVLGILLFAAVVGGGLFLFFFLKSQKGIQVYNLIEKEYICIGRQSVDIKNPILDLNEFKDIIQSNSFTFVIDKSITNKLFGKNISVTLDDLTVKHMVKGFNEQYRFNLELGGILDVE